MGLEAKVVVLLLLALEGAVAVPQVGSEPAAFPTSASASCGEKLERRSVELFQALAEHAVSSRDGSCPNLGGLLRDIQSDVRGACNATLRPASSHIDIPVLADVFDLNTLPEDVDLPALTTVAMSGLLRIFRHADNMLASTNQTIAPSHTDEPLTKAQRIQQLTGETINLQTGVGNPAAVLLSPYTWWVDADPVGTTPGCVKMHILSYWASWVALGYFMTRVQNLFSVSKAMFAKERRHVSIASIYAFVTSFVYALTVHRCSRADTRRIPEDQPQTRCERLARVRLNFVWPPLIFLISAWVANHQINNVDPDVDAFVYNVRVARRNIRTWEEGDDMAHGGRQGPDLSPEDSITATSPPVAPNLSRNMPVTVAFGMSGVALAIIFWLCACGVG